MYVLRADRCTWPSGVLNEDDVSVIGVGTPQFNNNLCVDYPCFVKKLECRSKRNIQQHPLYPRFTMYDMRQHQSAGGSSGPVFDTETNHQFEEDHCTYILVIF